MTPNPIVNVIINSNDTKHIKEGIKQIKDELESKGCEFPVYGMLLLGALLDKTEKAVKLKE